MRVHGTFPQCGGGRESARHEEPEQRAVAGGLGQSTACPGFRHLGRAQLAPGAHCSLLVRAFNIVHEPGTEVKHLPKVFLIDDDSTLLKSLVDVLGRHGYSVHYFASALEFMSQHHPAQVGCVLLDLLMPGTSGNDVLRFLQESRSLISVVIISGLVDPIAFDDQGETVALLEKPFKLSTLLTMIEDGIAGSFRRRAERHRGGLFD
jgi:CheY-like chemotaxis protein